VPELAGESVHPSLQRPARDHATTDAGPERDEQHLVDPDAGAETPFGRSGAGGVVVDHDPRAEAVRQARPDLEVGDAVEVRRGAQHTVASDQAGHPDADAPAVAERLREFEQHLDQRVEARVATRRRALCGVDDEAPRIEDDRLRFGPTDVDADPARWCRSDREGRVHASARAFNSRTVLRMRTSARRLTKPGSGIARSISRS
jgi:hypothetical protein